MSTLSDPCNLQYTDIYVFKFLVCFRMDTLMDKMTPVNQMQENFRSSLFQIPRYGFEKNQNPEIKFMYKLSKN